MHRLLLTFRQDTELRVYALVRGATSYDWQRIERQLAEALLARGLARIDPTDLNGLIMLTPANTFDRHARAQVTAQEWANRDATQFAVVQLPGQLGGDRFAVVTTLQAEGLLRGHPTARVTFTALPITRQRVG